MKPMIKPDGDGSSTGKAVRVPPIDLLLFLLGIVLLAVGSSLVFGIGIGLMVFGSAIMVLAVIS